MNATKKIALLNSIRETDKLVSEEINCRSDRLIEDTFPELSRLMEIAWKLDEQMEVYISKKITKLEMKIDNDF